MLTKLKCILLVDDYGPSNYFHQIIIREAAFAENVVVAETAAYALEFLKESKMPPDLILLDINMPGMNGWDFLREYQKLPEEAQSKTVILMLTTSLSGNDQITMNEFQVVKGCRIKPLSVKMLEEIKNEFFVANKLS